VSEETHITVEEAARRLNVPASAVRRHIREGRLPALRSGEREVRILPSDLEKLQTLLQGEEALAEE